MCDIEVSNHGSIFLFQPLTPVAETWISEHITEPIWYGGALAVEWRSAYGLCAGMLDDGLEVE